MEQESALTANDFGMKVFHQIIREGSVHPDVLWHLNKQSSEWESMGGGGEGLCDRRKQEKVRARESKKGGMIDWMSHRQTIRQKGEQGKRKWQRDSNIEAPGVLMPELSHNAVS